MGFLLLSSNRDKFLQLGLVKLFTWARFWLEWNCLTSSMLLFCPWLKFRSLCKSCKFISLFARAWNRKPSLKSQLSQDNLNCNEIPSIHSNEVFNLSPHAWILICHRTVLGIWRVHLERRRRHRAGVDRRRVPKFRRPLQLRKVLDRHRQVPRHIPRISRCQEISDDC